MPDISYIVTPNNIAYNIKDVTARDHALDSSRVTDAQTVSSLYKITVTNQGHIGSAVAVGITDNTTSSAPSSTDSNVITGRTLYNAIASTSEIDALFN